MLNSRLQYFTKYIAGHARYRNAAYEKIRDCRYLFSYSSDEMIDSMSISVYSKAADLLLHFPTVHLVKS